MIQANELRVGLCLLVCGEITQISSGFIADYDFSLRHNFSNNTPIARDSICPIPLTPEILEKAGFEKKRYNDFYFCYCKGDFVFPYDGKYFFYCTYNETGLFGYSEEVEIMVHQLQNLYFALTGEELQIDL